MMDLPLSQDQCFVYFALVGCAHRLVVLRQDFVVVPVVAADTTLKPFQSCLLVGRDHGGGAAAVVSVLLLLQLLLQLLSWWRLLDCCGAT